MEYFAGIDVSLRSCALCIVDGRGTVLLERELSFAAMGTEVCSAGQTRLCRPHGQRLLFKNCTCSEKQQGGSGIWLRAHDQF